MFNLAADDYRPEESTCVNETAYIIFKWKNTTNEFRLNMSFAAVSVVCSIRFFFQ